MECPAHRKLDRPLCPRVLRDLHSALDTGDFAGDYDLFVSVEVGGHHKSCLLAGALADLLDRCRRSSENRRHSSGTRGAGLVHQLATPPHELRRTRKADRVCGMVRREFSERMSRRRTHVLVQRVLGQRPNGCTMRKEGGLRIAGQSQLVRWSFEAESTQVQSERGVDLTKYAARDRE